MRQCCVMAETSSQSHLPILAKPSVWWQPPDSCSVSCRSFRIVPAGRLMENTRATMWRGVMGGQADWTYIATIVMCGLGAKIVATTYDARRDEISWIEAASRGHRAAHLSKLGSGAVVPLPRPATLSRPSCLWEGSGGGTPISGESIPWETHSARMCAILIDIVRQIKQHAPPG